LAFQKLETSLVTVKNNTNTSYVRSSKTSIYYMFSAKVPQSRPGWFTKPLLPSLSQQLVVSSLVAC